MKNTKNTNYERPETVLLEVKCRGIYLTSFNLNPLEEDNSDAESDYTQF